MISRDELLDRVLYSAWASVGSSTWRVSEAWDTFLPAEVRDRIIAARSYGHGDPIASAQQQIGRILKAASDDATTTVRNLGVRCVERARYQVVARGQVTALQVPDKAAALALIGELASKASTAAALLEQLQGELAALASVLEHDDAGGRSQESVYAEQLSSLARTFGDTWIPLRSMRGALPVGFDADALVDVPVDGLVLRRRRGGKSNWRQYRVELA